VAMAIETLGLSKSFRGVNALSGLDLRVPEHSIFGFLGPNGAGKSTTIKLLLGLIRPTAGTGRVFGLDIVQENVSIRKRVGYLAQDPRYYDHMTARETLRLTARFFYEGPAGAIEERVNETLDLVGLREKADRPIKGFSGGERQRLGIAQAQINYPDLLILDEPAASLDPMGRKDVLDIMERLRKHCTVFYSTHILDDVQRVSDHHVVRRRADRGTDRYAIVLHDPTRRVGIGIGPVQQGLHDAEHGVVRRRISLDIRRSTGRERRGARGRVKLFDEREPQPRPRNQSIALKRDCKGNMGSWIAAGQNSSYGLSASRPWDGC